MTAPSVRIWKFGAKFRDKAAQHSAHDIIFKANIYRNTLVDLERKRRDAVAETLRQLSPTLFALDQSAEQLDQDLEVLKKQVDDARVLTRSKAIDPKLKAQIIVVRENRKNVYKQIKSMKSVLYRDTNFMAIQDAIEVKHSLAEKDARSKCGIFWGSYLVVEEARKNDRKGAPPRFKSFESAGRIAVQVQGGCDVSDLFNGKSPHIQIDPPPPNSGKNPYRAARIRIGSDSSKKPVWLDFVVKIHRDPPSDSRVKWVWLHAKRVGTHIEWSLQIILAKDVWDDPLRCLEDEKVIAVDVGWRKLDSGIRVAYWADNSGKEGQVVIPQDQVDRMFKVRDLRSIQDKKFDAIRVFFKDEMKKHQIPQWMIDRTAFIDKWKSTRRMASVVVSWRDNRFQGDAVFFGIMEAWRKQNRHLYDWERAQAEGFLRWRDNLYQDFACHISRNYGKVIIEDIDWRIFAKLPENLSEKQINEYIRWHNKLAAVSYLNTEIKARVSKLDRDPSEWTTQACNVCSTIDNFDAEKELNHTCSKCGTKWDQDSNAAKNLLKWNASGGSGGGKVMAARSP